MNIKKYRVNFYKKGNMVYISHLDLMTLFRRSVRRLNLPFVLTGGFTPRVKISMPKALKLGMESESEEAMLFFRGEMDAGVLAAELDRELPDGIGVNSVEML